LGGPLNFKGPGVPGTFIIKGGLKEGKKLRRNLVGKKSSFLIRKGILTEFLN